MRVKARSFSIRPKKAFGGMLCLALMACSGAVYGTDPKSPDKANVKNNGAGVQLCDEPALQKPIRGEFRNSKAQDIVDLVRKETGQRLSLDRSVIQDRPLQEYRLLHNVPAWAALEKLARSPYIKGYWTKRGEEYVLIATYSGKPPPLPKQLPPDLREAMEKTRKGLPPDPPPKRASPAKRSERRMWWAASSLTFAVICVGLLFWRRTIGSSTTSKAPSSNESK